MDKPISVGDLVQVIKPTNCCNINGSMGRIFTVTEISPARKQDVCQNCFKYEPCFLAFGGFPNRIGLDLARLKRILPLSELETIDIQETIDA